MPRKPRPGTTAVLVQIPDDVHAAADARRRREGVTWSRVVTELLRRWAAGADDAALTASVRKPMSPQAPPEPGSERARFLEWSERWERENPEKAALLAQKVDASKLKKYPSLAALLAAGGAREGRTVSPEALAVIEAEEVEDIGDV